VVLSATTLGAAMLAPSAFAASCTGIAQPESEHLKDIQMRRPWPADYEHPLLKALAYGMSAPNPHNTQAWKFEVERDTQSILLYMDEKRMLTATDPPARQLHMGAGCFLAYLEIGMEGEGYKTDIDLLPAGAHGLEELGKKPVARIRLTKLASQTTHSPLYNQLFVRQTNRGLYKGAVITQDELQKMLQLAGKTHATTTLYTDEPLRKKIGDLCYKAFETETRNYETGDETRIWFRVKDDIALKRDGLNMRTSGTTGLKLRIGEKQLEGYKPEVWHKESITKMVLKDYRKKIDKNRGFISWITQDNTQLSWLKVGRDYARLQLAASELGIYFHPLSQSLEEYAAMDTPRAEMASLLGVSEPGKTQMLVMVGRAEPLPYSYRRHLASMIQQL